MSKNVAVFVDVANIFYAAKAAGVDIDYVTLLKNAIAGRDFVRAYAYTGLDPDNDNQRQFHQFLARHDYKVVSKDIRKYGDGKVKANLDIELVVDLMKTARNLDIAVVVSGDGDFAPAIRAVQEMGVRVEVICFRANTSSDLIEVADLFTEITQLARVDKDSSRSGRRVAAEDDLSMTEVPDKMSEGAPPRRRRTTRARPVEHDEPAVAATPTRGRRRAEPTADAVEGALVTLPGERLSRAAVRPSGEVDGHQPEAPDAPPLEAGEVGEAVDGADGDGEAAHRRRRRRGGRGRGRGRGDRPLVAGQPAGEVPVEAAEVEDEPDFAPPRAPQAGAFGSIWDSQLGVAGPPVLAGGVLDQEPDDEPEIPEYLLAERRQQHADRSPSMGLNRGGRGRGGAYQAALERERFGRAGAPSGPGFGNPNRATRPPVGRGPRPERGGPRQDAPRFDRPRTDRPARPHQDAPRPAADAAPWSEVPPELEAQLREELARRATPAPAPIQAAAPEAVVEARPRRSRAPRRAAAGVAAEPSAASPSPVAEAVTAAPRRTRAPRKVTPVEPAAAVPATVEPVPTTDTATAKPRRTRAPRKASAPEA